MKWGSSLPAWLVAAFLVAGARGVSGAGPESGFAVVTEGDTLTRIAARHGVTVRALSRYNARRLKRTEVLQVGDRLRLPPGARPSEAPEDAAGKVPEPAWSAPGGLVGPPWEGPPEGRPVAQAAEPPGEEVDAAADAGEEPVLAGSPLSEPPTDPNHWRDHILVRRGDTLMSIARREGVTVEALLAWNRLAEGDMVKAGKRLVVERPGPRPAARSIGRATEGQLAFGQWLGEGPGYRLRFPRNAYGTAETNERLRTCAAFVRHLFPGTADLLVGDLSRPGGGRFPPHESHQSGRDADAGYYLAGNTQNSTLYRIGPDALEPSKTWVYMRCLIAPGDVVRIYVDRALQRALVAYLERIGAEPPAALSRLFEVVGGASALIQHAPYHDTHLHVRLACAPDGEDPAPSAERQGAPADVTDSDAGVADGATAAAASACALEPGEAPFVP